MLLASDVHMECLGAPNPGQGQHSKDEYMQSVRVMQCASIRWPELRMMLPAARAVEEIRCALRELLCKDRQLGSCG